MPLVKKTIIPVGDYLVSRPDGSRSPKSFVKELLEKVVTNTNKMISMGLKVPVPFNHSKEAVPEETPNADAYKNAGYWQSVSLEEENGKYALCGVADVPGTEDDYDTPAGKLKHCVKEVSACIVDSWKDGLGRDWGPSMLHAAAVLNPVIPNQKEWEFLSLPEESFILSMSAQLPEQDIESQITELSKALEESVGIYLPPGTSREDLVRILLTSVKQYRLLKTSSQEDAEVVDTQAIFMSLPKGKIMPFTTEQATELVNLGLIDPKTKEAVTIDSLKDHISDEPVVDPAAKEEAQKWMSMAAATANTLKEERKTSLRDRVAKLIDRNPALKDVAEKDLFPQIDSYELSLKEGNFVKSPLETTIELLEATTPAKSSPDPSNPATWMSYSTPNGSETHNGPPENPQGDLSQEDQDKMFSEMLNVVHQ